ncbi:MAG: CCA tRNA nucleotidyltransferase, partial [Planctomycetia bacterium]|nr:CCA tRNA nucleotidyltransferase [Planctomycetia bacterium]
GRTPKDYDVATTATPAEIREVFGVRRTVAVGAAFGVIAVRGPKHAGQIEVATFRQDAAYSDGRHPDSVEFSTPEADAQRRDFTINGLFYDPLDNRVIDYVGGQDDLARGIIRAIGDPGARIAEDKLRLLRGVRCAAIFGFTLDPATRQAIEAMAPQITVVSAERIAAEMRVMLIHENRARAVDLLREVGLLDAILPELAMAARPDMLTATGRPADLAWLTALGVLDVLSAPRFPLALAALLHTFVDAAGTAAICRRWKLSNHEIQDTRWLVENQTALIGARHMAWPKLQRTLISARVDELLALDEAIARAAGRDIGDAEYCRDLLKMPPEQLNPAPLLTGDDLVAYGVPRGKQYQRLLESVRDAQLDKKINTKQQALALVDQMRGAK